jgi:hypothetical protein
VQAAAPSTLTNYGDDIAAVINCDMGFGKKAFALAQTPFLWSRLDKLPIAIEGHSIWKCNSPSANGAGWNSQGQVLSTAQHVALEERNNSQSAESAQ